MALWYFPYAIFRGTTAGLIVGLIGLTVLAWMGAVVLEGETYGRRALTAPNLFYFWRWYIRNAGRMLRARTARHICSGTARTAQAITKQGIVVGPSTQFLTEEGCEALAKAGELVLGISRGTEVGDKIARGVSDLDKPYVVDLIPRDLEHDAESPLVRLALDKKLLEIVSLYLGLWPRLHALEAWLNFPTAGEPMKSQLWHRDPEDLRLVKVFIYLVDVDENCGPFCYIPETHPFSTGAAKVTRRRITDEQMRVAFAPERWLTCTGPANTMILADTVGYHRGGRSTKGNRIVISLIYTSGTPFLKRVLYVSGRPTWFTHAIQRHAFMS